VIRHDKQRDLKDENTDARSCASGEVGCGSKSADLALRLPYRHCARLQTSRPMPITVEKEHIRIHSALAARARKVLLVACVADCLALIKHLTRVAAGRRRIRRVGV
jgi:hypothetical protein